MRVSLVALALGVLAVGCGSQRNTLDRLWHASGQTVALVPGTSEYAPGDLRFSFLVISDRGRAISRPTADVWVARSRNSLPFQRSVARLERIGVPGGYADPHAGSIYVAHVRVRRPGRYWVLARPIGGNVRIGGIHDVEVKVRGATPAVGSRAYPSQTPTLRTAPLRLLTTRIPPDRALLRYSVAQSLVAHKPFVLVFATPRFCTSRTCGPVVDVVDRVRRTLAGGGIRFIHVEIYTDNDPAKGENKWVRQWRLPTEPWTFLVGRDGRIKAKFEGSISVGELETAVRRLLA
ncbi:MAG: hypothetical protein E6G45_14535 [Actinobacteria bacterium]|nr:MAG: hypothetical protein E6G45_14535 [Actinomycetota bacterium]